MLLKTERMTGIQIDAEARRARVEAGVLSTALADAAAEHGLAYLAGTSPNVGVLGYALGGGLSWLIRTHGLACNSIVAAEVVTADGRRVRADRDTEPELFWAIRGGGGNFAAVTAIELELYPIPEIYAGGLFWPIERATEILNAWRTWIETVPEECESLGRMLQLPDVPFLPEHLRGARSSWSSSRSPAAPPTATPRPAAAGPRSRVRHGRDHADEATSAREPGPGGPAAVLGRGAPADDLHARGDRQDGRGVRRLAAPPRRGSPARRRRRGRARPDHGVLDAIDQPFVCFSFGLTFDPAALEAVERQVRLLIEAVRPWDSGRRYLNFAESRIDPRSIYPVESYERLRQAKARYDPAGMFLANHPVTPSA